MKKWIPILAVLLVVVCASGCTTQPQTYSGNGITFQYPGDWGTNWTSSAQGSFGSSGNVLASFGKDKNGVAVVKVNTGGINLDANTLTSAFRSAFQSQGQATEKTRTVGGVNATEWNMQINSANGTEYGSFTILKNNADVYMIIIGTSDNNQQTVDLILNSFKFQ